MVATTARRDVLAKWLVWSVWLSMTSVALVFIGLTAHNIPYHEDWVMVEPLTGHQPDFAGWVWRQNNEHRNPVPRLILLGLLKLTRGDFRAGLVFNVLTSSAVSAAFILVARRLRGGRTEIADAFFPLLLLHLGHSENFAMMSWQVAFLFPTLVVLLALCLLVLEPLQPRPTAAMLLALCLILLPLSGANGLLFVPFLACWCLFCGVRLWLKERDAAGSRWTIALQITGGAVSLALLTAYFVGYKPSRFTGVPTALLQKLQMTSDLLGLGLGPGTARTQGMAAIAVVAMIAATMVVILRAVRRQNSGKRLGAMAIFLAFAYCFLTVAAVGWGRAAARQQFGMVPIRYAILCAPLFCLMFLAWELYGSPKGRRVVQCALLLIMCLLLPLNTSAGLLYQKDYRRGMRAVERDILAGKSPLELARKHGPFLIDWWTPELVANEIQSLQDAHLSGFSRAAQTRQK